MITAVPKQKWRKKYKKKKKKMQEVTRLKNIFIFNHIESFLEGKCCGLQVVTRQYCRVIYDHSCIGLNQLYNPRGL